jgi:hypothetical protein
MRLAGKTDLVLGIVLSLGCGPAVAFAQEAGQTASHPTPGQADLQAAEQASEVWLRVLNSGHYTESWKTAAAAVQSAVTQEKWTATMKRVLEPMGKLDTRRVQSATHTAMLPGVPDGDYVVILYESSFEHKQTAQETVIMSREKDNVWRVAGYYIK